MSKRPREDIVAGEKKEKISKRRRTREEATSVSTDEVDRAKHEPALSADEVEKKARKAARKAERRALREQRRAKEMTGPVPGAEDVELASEMAIGNSGTSDANEAFLREKQITILDEGNEGAEVSPVTSFDELILSQQRVRTLFSGFKSPTPIQSAAWPYLLAGRDAIGVAETGSGKTMAFGVPCVEHVAKRCMGKRSGSVRACIVSPTRELALQIHEQMAKLAECYGLRCACVYGGVNKDQQRETLKGVSIIVATPGRLNDFIDEGSINLGKASYLVLDEADRMLDKGFEPEVRKIATNASGKKRQTLMFTATWPPAVRELASTFMRNSVRIMIGDNATGELRANTRIEQKVEVMDPRAKNDRLLEILRKHGGSRTVADRALVFCLYKKEAARVEDFIRNRGYKVTGIHGDLSQQKRTESLEAFKQGKVRLLVATDVAARGLDIPAVKLVINYTFPLTADDYVHRIGRTGRAGQTGESITFFTDHEKPLAGALINVLRAAKQPVPEELMKYGTTVKKKTHEAYGAFYKDPSEMKQATKITFD